MRCSPLNRALCFYGENMGIQSCFAKYGTKLKNVNWSVSALNEKAVSDGKDASKLKNKFHTREDWIGVVSLWDGDNFEITFKPET